MKTCFYSAQILLLSLLLGACASQQPPAETEEGLVLVEGTRTDLVYARTDLDLSDYNRILLHPAEVEFRRNWQQDQNIQRDIGHRVTDSDMARIANSAQEIFAEVFGSQLQDAGYALADEPGENVLEVRPSIINLDVRAPDTRSPGRYQIYATSVGEATLFIELYDAESGNLLARAKDRRVDPERDLRWALPASSVENRQKFERAVRYWAGLLIQALDDARDR